jgi:hypothetical protein
MKLEQTLRPQQNVMDEKIFQRLNMLKYEKFFQGLRCAKSHCFNKNEAGLQKINLPLCNLNLTHLTYVILLLIKKN